MKKIKQIISAYKKIMLQIIGLSIGYLITKNIVFIFLMLFFTVVFLSSKEIYNRLTEKIETIVGYIGNGIKSLLFILLFIFIIIPISVIQKIAKQKSDIQNGGSFYVEIEKQAMEHDFKKMW